MTPDCELCRLAGGRLIWRDARCRVVAVDEPGYPGFCRVIWNDHVAEMSDLDAADRAHCMAVVHGVELALRETLKPAKINLASLGNLVPHLHWHVIPRFRDDPQFPQPLWGPRQREGAATRPGAEAVAQAVLRRLQRLQAR
jgi:diadenosine tetraphosphate (Ap4A) HIT family hydrolase